MLEALTRDHQAYDPDDDARHLAQHVRQTVCSCRSLAGNIRFPDVYSERHARAGARTAWFSSTYPQLFVYAFALDPTSIHALPAPHHFLVPYYQALAAEQLAVMGVQNNQHQAGAAQLEEQIRSMVAMGMSPEAIADHVARQTYGQVPPSHIQPPPRNPNIFKDPR